MADPGDRQNQLPLHPDDKLTAVFVDHGGQKFVGNESAVKASFARVGSATYLFLYPSSSRERERIRGAGSP